MKPAARTMSRKDDHIRINLDSQVTGRITTGFENYRFEHLALPELDLDEVSTATSLFGRAMRAPVLISCMTGGTENARRINAVLAEVAREHGFAMGLGSGRALLEDPRAPGFDLRRLAPEVPLLANLGAAQLDGSGGVDACRRILDLTGADAIALHLNPLQEALQPEGEPRFRGVVAKIRALCRDLGAPVVVKEVGWGLAPDVVAALFDAGVSGVDVAGAGGTSWSEVEGRRATGTREKVAHAFAGWGIPTSEALVGARAAAPDRLVIASGGLRGGMDVALAIALGADLAGLAGPFLRAADRGAEAASDFAAEIVEVLRIAMFCIGAPDLASLRSGRRLVRLA